ncbi:MULTISPECIES: antibiotic biosynthesis monooxygenase family protein [Pigmentiphaga]|uniref:Antibiotic biosynthesis monooxygenase n=1 Tax=Pigmentiphaga daeguensis TaxID=414049 RepID=A0ABP3MAA3_9BURK
MAFPAVATIAPEAACLTLINVYEVEPGKQDKLARTLAEATERTVRHQPGFLSVCIHRSLDGRRVANYAQWASKEHFDRFMKQPETQAQLQRFASLAKTVAPGLYVVDTVHAAPRSAAGAPEK